jgi:LysW-gamma-L-lysine carboxypeptidase
VDESSILLRLARRYSPSGREVEAVREFARIARALGYRTRVDAAGNGVAERGRGRPTIVFLGHIDTVEGDRPVTLVRGTIHGRGVVDAKGPLASALLAGRRFPGPGTVRIVAAVGEETDSRGARHLLRGARPDALIVGEPSGGAGVTIAYKGDLRFEVEFVRERTHWSSPTPTAVDVGLAWLERLRDAWDGFTGPTPYRSLTWKVVGASAETEADPQRARWTIDARLPPGLTTDRLLAVLPTDPRPDAVRCLVRADPVEKGRADPVVRALVGAIRSEGGEPTLLRKAGTSDLNVVDPRWSVPSAAYGPGDARLDHTDREAVSVRELKLGTRVLARAFAELAASAVLTPRRSADVP